MLKMDNDIKNESYRMICCAFSCGGLASYHGQRETSQPPCGGELHDRGGLLWCVCSANVT